MMKARWSNDTVSAFLLVRRNRRFVRWNITLDQVFNVVFEPVLPYRCYLKVKESPHRLRTVLSERSQVHRFFADWYDVATMLNRGFELSPHPIILIFAAIQSAGRK